MPYIASTRIINNRPSVFAYTMRLILIRFHFVKLCKNPFDIYSVLGVETKKKNKHDINMCVHTYTIIPCVDIYATGPADCCLRGSVVNRVSLELFERRTSCSSHLKCRITRFSYIAPISSNATDTAVFTFECNLKQNNIRCAFVFFCLLSIVGNAYNKFLIH